MSDRIVIYNAGTVLFHDTFTDTDEVLLPAHTADTALNGAIWEKGGSEDLKITSNTADAADITPTSTDCHHFVDVQLQDLTVECDVTIADADNSTAFVICRYIDENNWLGIRWNQWDGFARAAAIVHVTAGGAVTALETFGAIPASADGETVSIKAVSTPTTVYGELTVGGVTYTSDTTYATTKFANATKAGIVCNQNLVTFDNFKITKT